MPLDLPDRRATRRDLPWPTRGLAYGGDYNPEQWPESVQREDVALMREAGVNLVTLGVFSWGHLEVADGEWELGWLDRVLDRLHENEIMVDLATPSAAPPIWLHRAHPEILPVSRTGVRYAQGGRLGWCPSSPVFRRYAVRMASVLAARYGDHPAVRMWHVGNEFGGGNRHCYCDVSAAHFRSWLTDRYGDVTTLNAAWGTAFWGHRYGSIDEVLPPRDSESAANPSLLLDFDRFSSDALLADYQAERDAVREHVRDRPVTTNFMVQEGPGVVDHAAWSEHVDIRANDHYLIADDPLPEEEWAFGADRMRGLDPSRPWLLMEHSTSAVNWQPRNRSKAPGELMRHSLTHVARGADGALFFQWRQSVQGAEQFHSAMLPHAGTRTKVWQEVVELGQAMRALGEVAGSTVAPAPVALLYDDVAGWAWQRGQKPHHDLSAAHAARDLHRALWRRGVTCDIVPPHADLSGRAVVLVPALYLTDDATAAAVASAAASGARVLVTYLSGTVDPDDRVRTGGYAGAFAALCGVYVEEFFVLQHHETVAVRTADGHAGTARDWTERVHADDATVLGTYAEGHLAGLPAWTRRAVGAGAAWYLSARLAESTLTRVVDDVLADAGLTAPAQAAPGIEVVRRVGEGRSWMFLINHTDRDVPVAATGHELLTRQDVAGSLTIPAGAVRAVREADRAG
ncbi:beta-galactosidase [Actinotalea sp. M2MS4P-6]|uniref:beta-galactosidase n=1 Tax=Actinotalea sp. M2MS4P-6 TaxID=2983762 RepID=UPI0021E441FE|nr:beta-galactosidase [Actinotalea sp. M2MS4P-6]MCV2394470.1 beta-galactosidase [Actinotalea sp. M2MS4P-6]